MQQGDVGWDTQCSGDVPSGSIQHHHRVHVSRQFTGELLKECVHDIGVHVRADQAAGVSSLRADGAEDIQIVILRLSDRPRTRADPGPHAGNRAVLSEAGFVLVVDQQTLVGMGRFELIQTLGQFFLKASSSAGSVSGCVVRGIRSL